jgi:DNA-directed RNA polymerase specialized sigma24 family protein
VAKKRKPKPNAETVKENSLSVELGRIAKLLALYLLKDVDDEGDKITRLDAVGFSSAEIAALLDKTENNVRVRISLSKTKRSQ